MNTEESGSLSRKKSSLPRMRVHRFIAHCGITSRRRAELLIEFGRVTVNGRVVKTKGQIVNPGRDRVAVNGEELSPPESTTILFNKPRGVITSTHDSHERLTVMDLLPQSLQRLGVLPVGRLDQDSEGLLLLTNMGELSHRIAHPSHETEKEYEALVAGRPEDGKLKRLERGVSLEGQRTAPAVILSARHRGADTLVTIVLHEGRKRQVRRMFQSVGHDVIELRRTRVGGLRLEDLKCGEWRRLTDEEIMQLTAPAAATVASPSRRTER